MSASQISLEQIPQKTRGWAFKSDLDAVLTEVDAFCQPEESGQDEHILTI